MRQLSYLPSIGPGVRRLLNETAQLLTINRARSAETAK